MILKIISDAKWKYPIYFAVTVPSNNRLGLEDYIEMEGLVYRLRPFQVDKRNPINEERMWTNLMSGFGSDIWEKDIEAEEWNKLEGEVWSKDFKPGYLYRNLGRDDVFYFPSTNIRLLQNLRSAHMQLAAYHYMVFKDFEKTNPEKAEFRMLNHGRIPFAQGKAFMLDVSNQHWCYNESNEHRLHIIVHASVSDNIIEKSYANSRY